MADHKVDILPGIYAIKKITNFRFVVNGQVHWNTSNAEIVDAWKILSPASTTRNIPLQPH